MSSATPQSLAELRAVTAGGGRVKYLFFWGHQPQPDGKARLFGDEEVAAQMLAAAHPGAVKTFGRQVRDFEQTVWDAHCFELVVAANVAKFGQHPDLGQYLSRTPPNGAVRTSSGSR